MALRNVQQVRDRVLLGMQRELSSLRSWLSSTGNHEAVEKLRGNEGDACLSRVADKVLEELGHETEVTSKDPQSQTRRRARGAMGNVNEP